MTWLLSGGWIVIVCIVCPFMLFQEPIKKAPPTKRKAKSGRKQGRNGKPKKTTIKKSLQVEKPKKAKKQKPYKAPELSPEQQAIFARYQAGRMGIKYDQ